jgi:pimeloyl-ACP methyl ester carboxylesterase
MEKTGVLEHDGERLAWRRVEGEGPTVVWLGGFRSDMNGTKAQFLADWALGAGRDYLRFDYSGHGASSGDFAEGTIGRWRSDALAVVDRLTEGPIVLVGSSMGGWIACLVALARHQRVKAMALLAPAADFTEQLIEPGLSDEAREALARDGRWMQPSEYGEPYPITQKLLRDGRMWSILPGPLDIPIPIRILQGELDADVPTAHAVKLAQALASSQPDGSVRMQVAKGGDHRLSRSSDLGALLAMVSAL